MEAEMRELRRKRGASAVAWQRAVLGPVILLAGALLLAGCPKKPEVATGAPRAEAPAPVPEAKREPAPSPAKEPLQDVFFDFDKAIIRDDGKQALNADIQWLKVNSAVRIKVEGHCDERGTTEYNLALGERRAKVVRDYLAAGGIDAKRISTISYGKERPFVQGHDESAWKWNRRGHFVVVK
ncbi:MAG: peptidoglycan-associated lipoprotein Pal [Candidatus Methylomirabilales bacterium]